MTGQQYLDSLRDGREIYIYGGRVEDVTTHRVFRNASRSIARLYDALHDAKHKETLLATDRQGILTHKFFKPSYSAQELMGGAGSHRFLGALLLRLHGRTPDCKASFMATLGAAPDFYDPYTENAARWYRAGGAPGPKRRTPGEPYNARFAAHRSSRSRPFFDRGQVLT